MSIKTNIETTQEIKISLRNLTSLTPNNKSEIKNSITPSKKKEK